jgi:hypothetical protein
MISIFHLSTQFAAATGCGSSSNFLLFPTWYEYLHKTVINGLCTPQLNSLADIWLIVAAVIEIMLRIAALVAVGYTMYGGFTYVTSQGEPGKTAKARDTIISALAGLAIAVIAAVLVGFIAGRIS